MKKERVLLSVIMVAAMFLGAFSLIMGRASEAGEYKSEIEKAEVYAKDHLYQLSIDCYANALAIKESDSVRKQYIEVYKTAYRDNLTDYKGYFTALNASISLYPKESYYYLQLADLELNRGKYEEAYNVCNKAIKNGAGNDEINKTIAALKYSYRTEGRVYDKYAYSPDGNILLVSGNKSGVLAADGESIFEVEYEFVSPMSSTGEVFAVDSSKRAVYNSHHVIIAFFDEEYIDVKACSEGILPYQKTDGRWSFFDCEKKQTYLSGYDDESSFQNGVAVIKQGDFWQLIGKDGKAVSDTKFSDVKLFDNGEFMYKGVFVASVNGVYGIYDKSGELKAALDAIDADCYYGGYIAFCDKSGKWGFVNEKGEVVIKPEYNSAKSFSNGMGAVCDGEKWGFINKDSTLVIDCTYEEVGYFSKNKRCIVSDVAGNYYFIELRF